jgi:hypothetical protein
MAVTAFSAKKLGFKTSEHDEAYQIFIFALSLSISRMT